MCLFKLVFVGFKVIFVIVIVVGNLLKLGISVLLFLSLFLNLLVRKFIFFLSNLSFLSGLLRVMFRVKIN